MRDAAPERFEQISTAVIAALRAGNYLETAAVYAGTSKQNLYNWLRQGSSDRAADRTTRLADFFDAVARAQAEAEVAGVAGLNLLARDRMFGEGENARVIAGSVAALTWRMERKWPDRWGRRAPGPAPAVPPPPEVDEVVPTTAREKLLKELAGIRERRRAGAA